MTTLPFSSDEDATKEFVWLRRGDDMAIALKDSELFRTLIRGGFREIAASNDKPNFSHWGEDGEATQADD